MVASVAERFAGHEPKPGQSVIVASLDVRLFLRGLLVRDGLDVAVLSYQDLAPEFPVHPIGPIGLRVSSTAMPAVTAE